MNTLFIFCICVLLLPIAGYVALAFMALVANLVETFLKPNTSEESIIIATCWVFATIFVYSLPFYVYHLFLV